MKSVEWLEDKLKSDDNIKSINVISDQLIQINHKNDSILNIAVTSLRKITLNDISPIILNNTELDFIVNIPHDPYIDGLVFSHLEHLDIPLGGVGDLYRILSDGTAIGYMHPEVRFITRGLNQHSKVERFERLNNKAYKIYRKELPPVVVVAINDYEFSSESVRSGKEMYNNLDAILSNNPNARISGEAYALGESLGISILKWGELLSKLNK